MVIYTNTAYKEKNLYKERKITKIFLLGTYTVFVSLSCSVLKSNEQMIDPCKSWSNDIWIFILNKVCDKILKASVYKRKINNRLTVVTCIN